MKDQVHIAVFWWLEYTRCGDMSRLRIGRFERFRMGRNVLWQRVMAHPR